MNKADVVDVLSFVQAGDRRTVGEGDVEMWFLVVAEVPKDFAISAVVAHFRDRPGVWLEPGHIFQRWRDHRRDQLSREDDAAREARQEALDARLAEIDELAEAKSLPAPGNRYRRRTGPNPLQVVCPWCHAGIGRACRIPQTTTTVQPHPSRVEAAATKETA
jgi:hypothetical protein